MILDCSAGLMSISIPPDWMPFIAGRPSAGSVSRREVWVVVGAPREVTSPTARVYAWHRWMSTGLQWASTRNAMSTMPDLTMAVHAANLQSSFGNPAMWYGLHDPVTFCTAIVM